MAKTWWVKIGVPMDPSTPSIQPGPEVPHDAGGEGTHCRRKLGLFGV